jgi:hypothetical protein
LPFQSQRIQPGQESFQRKPDAASSFGAMKRLDVAFVAVAFDGRSQENDEIDHPIEASKFVALGIERLWVWTRSSKQGADTVG